MDRLERDLEGRAQVLRLNILGETGRAAAIRYGVRGVPTFLVFDGEGRLVAQSLGLPDRKRVQALLESLTQGASG